MSRPLFLAAMGDANDPLTFSGTARHFLDGARAHGLPMQGLPLAIRGRHWQFRRLAWNAARLVTDSRPGGYQFSASFLERLWAPVRDSIAGSVIVNAFQLYPPSVVDDGRVSRWYYIDSTLLQLWETYGTRGLLGRRMRHDVLARERDGYLRATGILAMSEWAARSLVTQYGVPRERVHVAIAGANLDRHEYARWEAAELERRAREGRPPSTGLKLVFVGVEWRRKGLDRLLAALSAGRRRGLRATLRVIGMRRDDVPPELRDVDGVEWMGFVHKGREPQRFLSAVAECDVGCLLSLAECGGIVIREYAALGLGALGTEAGGTPEWMLPGTGICVPTTATPDDIADRLLALESDPAALDAMRRAAWEQRHLALWDHTFDQIGELLSLDGATVPPTPAVSTPRARSYEPLEGASKLP